MVSLSARIVNRKRAGDVKRRKGKLVRLGSLGLLGSIPLGSISGRRLGRTTGSA